MRVFTRTSLAALALLVLATAPAAAKVCKDNTVSATSREYISRSLGAFPGSWAAWRDEVKTTVGNGWQAWRRAEDPKINCREAENSEGKKRWTCTRTARPCRAGNETAGTDNTDDEVGSAYVPIDQVLRRNMKGEQVRTLQYLLREAGYNVAIDGDFGATTQRELIKFQRKSGLKVDGRAGPDTIEALTG